MSELAIQPSFDTLRPLEVGGRTVGHFHSLPALEAAGLGRISRLPLSIRIMLESLVRNLDGQRVTPSHVRQLAGWTPHAARVDEVPFIVARIIAPDASGIPLLADLAAMREVAVRHGLPAAAIEPSVPVDLIVDHSLVVERAGTPDALQFNLQQEYRRNEERYLFLKWAAQAFKAFRIIPPGIGIVHQVNLEYLARGVLQKDGVFYPDTLVGTDSHTSMINGIGVLGWGVGGIEAEAGMLGQPVYLLTPDVVGVELRGELEAGATSTDLALTVVERLRRHKVVGKFVEFFGDGAARLSAADRATISNMAPEYGATAGYFPVDRATLAYLRAAGRSEQELATIEAYFRAQHMFGMPAHGDIDYSETLCIDLAEVRPSVAGPSRPQDRIPLDELKPRVRQLLAAAGPAPGKDEERMVRDGDVVIAAITSCANTSNPAVLLAAGLLAKKAVERGLCVGPKVKTSFTPGSRVVHAYLVKAGLQFFLDRLGFQVAGFGCATCIGNSGPLPQWIEDAVERDRLVVASVLSGNRNFEARIHPAVKANFLMSPPLVVAFALAGRIDLDLRHDPLGHDASGAPVYLRDIWPSRSEIDALMPFAADPANFRKLYDGDLGRDGGLWDALPAPGGELFAWDEASSYLRRPPFFDDFSLEQQAIAPIRQARALAILGDSVTTDHISPGGAIDADSEAGKYLASLGVRKAEFNTYVTRRTHDGVMARGTFANVRLRNLMVPDSEGGVTRHQPSGAVMSIFEAARAYRADGVPTVVLAGEEYGNGSSRDWAAKGPRLLGVRAVVARSFERIHRSNLVGMGILPCQFIGDDSVQTLGLRGDECFELIGIENGVRAQQEIDLLITRTDGSRHATKVRARIDTRIEEAYFRHGGILPFVLRQLLNAYPSPEPRV